MECDALHRMVEFFKKFLHLAKSMQSFQLRKAGIFSVYVWYISENADPSA